ncbi:unnamed protein product, partial [Bubo scandiacus]
MPTVTLWLPLVWLVATVTPVPTPEASPQQAEAAQAAPDAASAPPSHPGTPGGMWGPPSCLTTEGPPSTTERPLSTTWGPLSTTERPLSTTEGTPQHPGHQRPTVSRGRGGSPRPAGHPRRSSGQPWPRHWAPSPSASTSTWRRLPSPTPNLLFSPINVVMGLSHLLLGARGETRERLAAVLAHPPGLACPHTALRQLAGAPGLFSAAQIFHHPGLSLRPRFLNESWHFYGARPRALSGNESLDLLRVNASHCGAEPKVVPRGPPGPPHPPQPQCRVPAATWRTPLKAKQTVPLALPAPRAPAPAWCPPMTSKKYPVASFIDHRLQVQVGRLELSGGPEPGGAGATGAPGGTGGPWSGRWTPPTFLGLLRRAAHTPPRATALAPAPPAPRPRPGCGSPGPRHGLRAVPGRGAVRAGAGAQRWQWDTAPAPGGAGAGPRPVWRRRVPWPPRWARTALLLEAPAPLPLRPLARRRHRPPLHGPPQRPPAL